MDETSQTLNDEGRDLWNQKAAFWDEIHGDEGNLFHRRLVSPAVEKLLDVGVGDRVLDVACGSGVLARRLAMLGAHVTATDFSAALIERAQARRQQGGEPINYQVADATDETALVTLGAGQFDAIVSTMALMDMPEITPLFRAVGQLLKPEGCFVFATAHPAFNSNDPVFFSEMTDKAGELIFTRGVKIHAYREIPPLKVVGTPNEPAPHYFYHRPLGELLNEAFATGLVLDALEEPTFTAEDRDTTREHTWRNLPQIPPVMAGRLRRG